MTMRDRIHQLHARMPVRYLPGLDRPVRVVVLPTSGAVILLARSRSDLECYLRDLDKLQDALEPRPEEKP